LLIVSTFSILLANEGFDRFYLPHISRSREIFPPGALIDRKVDHLVLCHIMVLEKDGKISGSTDPPPVRQAPGGVRSDEGETAIYRTRLHWVTVLAPAVVMMLSGMSIPGKGMSAVVLLTLATIWGVLSSISLERSQFLVTRRRVMIKTGFPWRRSHDLSLADIGGVYVYQPSLGKVLNFGKLTFKMKSGKRLSFRLVRDPLQLAGVVNQCGAD
jgi:hypothetical protein